MAMNPCVSTGTLGERPKKLWPMPLGMPPRLCVLATRTCGTVDPSEMAIPFEAGLPPLCSRGRTLDAPDVAESLEPGGTPNSVKDRRLWGAFAGDLAAGYAERGLILRTCPTLNFSHLLDTPRRSGCGSAFIQAPTDSRHHWVRSKKHSTLAWLCSRRLGREQRPPPTRLEHH